jgi:hypothetical protein
MEEEKRRKLEAKLNQLFAQYDQSQDQEGQQAPMPKTSCGIKLIRRRKGNPDKHIA